MNGGWSNTANWIRHRFDALNKFLAYLSATVVAASTSLVVLSSVMRYFLGRPFHFAEELGAIFFMAISVLPIAYIQRINRHIRISVVFERIPQPVQRYVELMVQVLTLCFAFTLVLFTWRFASETYYLKGRSLDAGMILWPWMAIVPLSLTLFALQILTELIDTIVAIFALKRGR